MAAEKASRSDGRGETCENVFQGLGPISAEDRAVVADHALADAYYAGELNIDDKKE